MIGKLDYIKIDAFYSFSVERPVIEWETISSTCDQKDILCLQEVL